MESVYEEVIPRNTLQRIVNGTVQTLEISILQLLELLQELKRKSRSGVNNT